jgi:predicted hydrocarbon binding protein
MDTEERGLLEEILKQLTEINGTLKEVKCQLEKANSNLELIGSAQH